MSRIDLFILIYFIKLYTVIILFVLDGINQTKMEEITK